MAGGRYDSKFVDLNDVPGIGELEADWVASKLPLHDVCVVGCLAEVQRLRDQQQGRIYDVFGPLAGVNITTWKDNFVDKVHQDCSDVRANNHPVAASWDDGGHLDKLNISHDDHVAFDVDDNSQAYQYWEALVAVWNVEIAAAQSYEAFTNIHRYGGCGADWSRLFYGAHIPPVDVHAIWNADDQWNEIAETLQERVNTCHSRLQDYLKRVADRPNPDVLIAAVTEWRSGYRPPDVPPGQSLHVEDVPSLDNVRRPLSLDVYFERICTATVVQRDYDRRSPGHLFRLFAAVAAQVANDEWQRHLPTIPPVHRLQDIDEEPDAAVRTIMYARETMRDAIVTGGRESLTHHALYGRGIDGKKRLFPEVVHRWIADEMFTSFSVTQDRRRATFKKHRPLQLALQAAVAAVDPVWDAMFDECAAQFPNTIIIWNAPELASFNSNAWLLCWAVPMLYPTATIDDTHSVAVVPGVVAEMFTTQYSTAVFTAEIPNDITITSEQLPELTGHLAALDLNEWRTDRTALTNHLTSWMASIRQR